MQPRSWASAPRRRRRRMRPRLPSRPLWRMPAQSPRGRGASAGRVPAGSGRGGASRPRLPLRHGLALRTLPLLSGINASRQSPARAGFFVDGQLAGGLSSTRKREDGIPPSRELDQSRLTSNGGASSGGASASGGDASPNPTAAPTPVTAAPAPMPPAPAPVMPRPRPQRTSSGVRRSTSSPVVTAGCASLFPGGSRPSAAERLRHQRRGLRARGQRRRARGKSKGEFQKMAAFHDISLVAEW